MRCKSKWSKWSLHTSGSIFSGQFMLSYWSCADSTLRTTVSIRRVGRRWRCCSSHKCRKFQSCLKEHQLKIDVRVWGLQENWAVSWISEETSHIIIFETCSTWILQESVCPPCLHVRTQSCCSRMWKHYVSLHCLNSVVGRAPQRGGVERGRWRCLWFTGSSGHCVNCLQRRFSSVWHDDMISGRADMQGGMLLSDWLQVSV